MEGVLPRIGRNYLQIVAIEEGCVGDEEGRRVRWGQVK
jgi:hypothetical protein